MGYLILILKCGQRRIEVPLSHLMGRERQGTKRLDGIPYAPACEQEHDDATNDHEDNDDDAEDVAKVQHEISVLTNDHLPTGIV